MWPSRFLKRCPTRVSLVLFLCVLLAGCDTSLPPVPVKPTSMPSSNSTNDLSQLPRFNLPADASLSDLHLHTNGAYCIPDAEELKSGVISSDRFPRSNLILATGRLSYDTGETQSIENYLQENYDHVGEYNFWTPPLPPTTLQWVQGGDICIADLEITNMGDATLQVANVGVQLVAAPQKNTYRYRQVDICSGHELCPGEGGQTNCTYKAQVSIGEGTTGAQYSGPVESTHRNDPKCPVPLTLSVGESSQVTVFFTESEKQTAIYHVMAELQVVTFTGAHTITFPTFASALVFAYRDQFSCYRLQDKGMGIFVPEQLPSLTSNTTRCV